MATTAMPIATAAPTSPAAIRSLRRRRSRRSVNESSVNGRTLTRRNSRSRILRVSAIDVLLRTAEGGSGLVRQGPDGGRADPEEVTGLLARIAEHLRQKEGGALARCQPG